MYGHNTGTIGRNWNANEVYGANARFDGTAKALDEDALRRIAPSVFATTAHESRSDRFRPIPTIEIIRGLNAEGFSVVGAKQSVTRMPDRKDFTKHLLRLRKLDDDVKNSVGGTVFEMLLKNANDGTAAYDLMGGLFKIQCLNSLVALLETLDTIKVRHSGDVQSKVIEGTFKVLESAELALAAPQDWSQLRIDRDERMAFAEAAHVLRFADSDGEVHTPIQPAQLLIPRRASDTDPNVWNVFNVIQENALKGGLHGRGPNAEGVVRNTTSRAVKGIDQDVKLNKALWVLADRMAQIKKAA